VVSPVTQQRSWTPNGYTWGVALLLTGLTETIHPLRPVLILLVELALLYTAGAQATGRLYGLARSFPGGASRLLFYALVFPGVALHECAHFAACLLSATKVARFRPFAPREGADGRVRLGYVSHERRPAPLQALIGLAPVAVNPLGILILTTLLTPLSPIDLTPANPAPLFATLYKALAATPAPVVVLWAYLCVSFALGSVPSREDLSSVPAAILAIALAVLLLARFGGTAGFDLLTALCTVAAFLAPLYALPTAVALAAFVLVAALSRP